MSQRSGGMGEGKLPSPGLEVIDHVGAIPGLTEP
jgi:hypothetical protein